MSTFRWIWNRCSKCDTGERLNPLMHIFLYITLVFSIGFLWGPPSVTASILYMETMQIGGGAINSWGLVGLATTITHTLGVFLRNKYSIRIMGLGIAGGFYLWLWAAIVYALGGFWFQLLVAAVPNLAFWTWYAIQWWIRYRNPNNPNVAAFVN